MRLVSTAAIALLALAPAQAVASTWTWPVRGEVVTAYSYEGDSYAPGQHRGVDIRARPGQPVLAAVAGSVTFAGEVGDAGLTLTIRTADGRYDTTYLHLGRLAVSEGEGVVAGQRIAEAGASGRPRPRTPHVHFGVRAAGSSDRYRDPLAFLGAARPTGPGSPLAGRRRPGLGPGARGPAPAFETAPGPRPVPARAPDFGLWAAGGAIALGAAIAVATVARRRRRAASSIAGPWATTSRRRSTT